MNNHQPVGENRPPQFPAAKNNENEQKPKETTGSTAAGSAPLPEPERQAATAATTQKAEGENGSGQPQNAEGIIKDIYAAAAPAARQAAAGGAPGPVAPSLIGPPTPYPPAGVLPHPAAGPYAPPSAGLYQPRPFPAPAQRAPAQPYTATRADGVFALFCCLLGFLFVRWMLEPWQGWGITVVTVLYAAGVLLYAQAKGVQPARSSWYWLTLLLGLGTAYFLHPPGSMALYQGFLLVGVAVYWAAQVFGGLLLGKTGNLLGLDIINLTCVVAWSNLSLWVQSVKTLPRKKDGKNTEKTAQNRRAMLAILLGLGICVPFLAIVIPMLLRADAGGFESLLNNLGNWLQKLLSDELWTVLWQLVLGGGLGMVICAYLAGLAHQRYTKRIEVKTVQKNMEGLRGIPTATLGLVLVVVSAVYALFIGTQIPYFFSAFGGELPAGYIQYSQYAREGFFELCRIAAINLGLLAVANTFGRRKRVETRLLQVLNLLLCCLTLLVLATAFSKMALYIQTYGLTPKRVLTSVFMIFLALVCGAVIALQWKSFSVVRFAAVVGSALLCTLCLINMDGMIMRYNAWRVENGTLNDLDYRVVEQTMPGGFEATRSLLINDGLEGDGVSAARRQLERQREEAGAVAGTHRDTILQARVRGTEIDEAEQEPVEEQNN